MRAALAAALILIAGCGEPAPPPPSLLLITSDRVGAEALPCYGGAGGAGTAVCELAERGALFLWAFSTDPGLAPAAATLLTSLPAEEHGVTRSAVTFLRSDVWTLAGALSRAGVATAAFVSAAELNRSRNLQLGFGHYEVTAARAPETAAAATTRAFQSWLDRRSRSDGAWFAWLHYPGTASEVRPPVPAWSIAALDGEVAAALAAARSAAPDPDLGVAFTALSGEARDEAAPLALERIRVPLLWSPPGGVAAQRLAAPVGLLDLAPTLLRAVGATVPGELAGEPLRVAPLPPAEVRPARPLRLASGDEIGVVISRRYYARPVGADRARTALLPDDGTLPAVSSLAVGSETAEPYEAEISMPAAPDRPGLATPAAESTFLESGRPVPRSGSASAAVQPEWSPSP
jgi:hypothetical protein